MVMGEAYRQPPGETIEISALTVDPGHAPDTFDVAPPPGAAEPSGRVPSR